MPSFRVVYFPTPGRGEPTRLTLALGGHEFTDDRITKEEWGKLKPEVAPKQLPLLYVDGECVAQSYAVARYAAKISSVDGKPLYPVDPLEALRVDEFCDTVAEVFPPIADTFAADDQAAAVADMMAEDGPVTKWVRHIDGLLGNSKSGFAIGDSLTLADVCAFIFLQALRTGLLPYLPTTCLDQYKNICKHSAKIASIPQVAEYYKGAEGPYTVYMQ